VGCAQPAEHRFVRSGRNLAVAAGYDDDVRIRHRVQRMIGNERKCALVGGLRAGLGGDERDVRVRETVQDLVRADGVERGELVEEQDCYLHAADATAVAGQNLTP
jgi:hypothetical protein